MLTANQNPEQLARDKIDAALHQCGWHVQNKSSKKPLLLITLAQLQAEFEKAI